MKKIFATTLLLCSLFVGCQTDNLDENGKVTIANGKTIVKVSTPDTRTYLGEKVGDTYPVYWNDDDKICINYNLSSKITIDPNNPASAEFEFDAVLDYPFYISHFRAPSNINWDSDASWYDESLAVIISPKQAEEVANSFQQGYAPLYGIVEKSGDPVKLHHLGGILRFSVKAGEEAKTLSTITIKSGSGAPIAGGYIINPIYLDMVKREGTDITELDFNLSDGCLTPYAAIYPQVKGFNTDYITYSCDTSKPLSASKERVFYIVVPDGLSDLCYIELAATDGEKMLCAWNAKNIKAGVVKEFSTLTFKAGGIEDLVFLQEMDSEQVEELEFDDIFGYVKDINGNPIAGVAVSDGLLVTTTDEKGYYKMSPSSDSSHIFITLPAEYEVPVNEYGQPCFYQKYPGKQEYSFTLTPLSNGKEQKFALFAIADPQIWEEYGFNRLRNEAIPGIAKHRAEVAQSMPCYGITLGDIISTNPSKNGDASEYREPLREQFSKAKVGMPVFHVMGNHDNNYSYHGGGIDPQPDKYNSTWQIKMQRDHEAVFGPANYSFDRGDIHIVGMRNVEYYISSGGEYTSRLGFSNQQIEWLRQDLELVPKDKMVVFCAHIQFVGKESESADKVLELLSPFKEVHLLTGHSHINHNHEHDYTTAGGKKIYEHNVSALCGSWWDSNITMDGTPVGYQVFVGENDTFSDWYYMGYTNKMDSRSHQMRLYRGDAITGGKKSGSDTYGVKGYYKFNFESDILLANVYNADSNWKVEVYEDGVYSGEMILIPNNPRPYHDNQPNTSSVGIDGNGSFEAPYYSTLTNISSDMHFTGLYLGILGKKDKNYNTYANCYHMYKYRLKSPNAKIMVKAIDRFGNVYTETNITAGTDYSITGL